MLRTLDNMYKLIWVKLNCQLYLKILDFSEDLRFIHVKIIAWMCKSTKGASWFSVLE